MLTSKVEYGGPKVAGSQLIDTFKGTMVPLHTENMTLWVMARPEPLSGLRGLFYRLAGAYQVLRGRSVAVHFYDVN